MKKATIAVLVSCVACPGLAHAALIPIDLSPAFGALNLGSTTYTQDHAVGLDSANETTQPASTASGDELGAGITYDDVSNLLSFDFGYGSAFGFSDLESDWLGLVHIHGPGAVNFPAANFSGSVVYDLGSFHTASGTRSGRVTGSLSLTSGQETHLFENLLYINVHSVDLAGGELRGQLVPVPEPGTSALAITGLLSLVLYSWRRRSRLWRPGPIK